MKLKYILLGLMVFFLFCGSASACDVYLETANMTLAVTDNTYYCLSENIHYVGLRHILVSNGASDGTIDCQGYIVSGNSTTDWLSTAGTTETVSNYTIKNCVFHIFNSVLTVGSGQGVSSDDWVITNNTFKNSTNGIYQRPLTAASSDGWIISDNDFYNNSYGVYNLSDNNVLYDNIFRHNTQNINMFSSDGNNFTNNRIYDGGSLDYLLRLSGLTNNFTEANFTASRKIYYQDSTSSFNLRNATGDNVWLKTNISGSTMTVDREITNWQIDNMKWNDTASESPTLLNYTLEGLNPSTFYSIYNDSVIFDTKVTDSAGLLQFTLSFNDTSEHMIEVDGQIALTTTQITPATAYTNNALDCGFQGYGVGTLEVNVTWFKDNAAHTSDDENEISYTNDTLQNTSSTGDIESSDTASGETWICQASLYNASSSSILNSSSVTISNTVPVTNTPTVYPTTAYHYNNLMCEATMYDIDDADTITAYFNWYKDDVLDLSSSKSPIANDTAMNISTLNSGNTSKGENWICEAIPYDGSANGTASNSTAKAISNFVPVTSYVNITPLAPKTGEDLIGNGTCYDMDADSLTAYYLWYVDKALNETGSKGSMVNDTNTIIDTLTNTSTTKSELWTLGIICNDGTANGTQVNSSDVTIDNTNPTAPVPGIPTNLTNTNDNTVIFNWTVGVDADGQTVYYLLVADNTSDFSSNEIYQNTSTTNNYTSSALVDGEYFWRVMSMTLDGNSSYSGTMNLTIDATVPTVTITDPINASSVSTHPTLTFGYTELNIDTCMYSFNLGANTSITSCFNTTTLPSVVGSNNVTVYVNDTFGNSGSDFVYYSYTTPGGGTGNGNGGGGGGDPEAVCGNDFCEPGEHLENCPEDCLLSWNPNFTFGLSPERISAWTAPEKTYIRDFDVLNLNEEKITVNCYFVCIENDASCEWISFVENDTLKDSVTFVMIEGNERLPTRHTVRFNLTTPENIPIETYRVNIICESSGLKKVLPVTLESLATLGPLGFMIAGITGFWDANVMPFPAVYGMNGIYGSHVILLVIGCFAIVTIYTAQKRNIYTRLKR